MLYYNWHRHQSAAIWCHYVVLKPLKPELVRCHLVPLCCIAAIETWNGVLLSGAVMLYYNPWSLNQFTAIWYLYVVLQRLKRAAECCYLMPVYCITTTEAWASCDRNQALTMRFHFSQLCCRQFKPPGILLMCRLFSTHTLKFRQFVALCYTGPKSLETVDKKCYTLRVKSPLSFETSILHNVQ